MPPKAKRAPAPTDSPAAARERARAKLMTEVRSVVLNQDGAISCAPAVREQRARLFLPDLGGARPATARTFKQTPSAMPGLCLFCAREGGRYVEVPALPEPYVCVCDECLAQ